MNSWLSVTSAVAKKVVFFLLFLFFCFLCLRRISESLFSRLCWSFPVGLRPARVLEDSCFGQVVIAPPAGECCEDSLVRLRQCHRAASEHSQSTVVGVTLIFSRQGFLMWNSFSDASRGCYFSPFPPRASSSPLLHLPLSSIEGVSSSC